MPDSSSSSGSSQSSAGSGSSGSSSARVSTPTLPPDKQHSWKVVGGLVFCLAVIVGAGLLAPRAVAWVVTFLAMGGMMWLIGSAVSGTPWGAFITQRNLISLARFQAVLWTVLILSAYSTYVLQRVNVRGLLKPAAVAPADVNASAKVTANDGPWDVGIDKLLWALLGISTTSLVGSSLLAGTKRGKEPTVDAVSKAADKLQEPSTEINKNRQGTLYVNPDPKDARLTDMFMGDEVGDTAHVDLGKVQMFFFTVVVAVVYGVMIFRQLCEAGSVDALQALPPVSDGMIALLGISHAGYLTKAGLSQTQTK